MDSNLADIFVFQLHQTPSKCSSITSFNKMETAHAAALTRAEHRNVEVESLNNSTFNLASTNPTKTLNNRIGHDVDVACTSNQESPKDDDVAHTAMFRLMNGQEAVEVLDMILVCLNFKTLLRGHKVSETWNHRIQVNSDLQKKLFLKPTRSLKEVKRLNMIDYDTVAFKNPSGNLNPCVVDFLGSDDKDDIDGRVMLSLAKGVVPFTIGANRGCGTWENMYLCQPPKNILINGTLYAGEVLDSTTYTRYGRRNLCPKKIIDTDLWSNLLGAKTMRDIVDATEFYGLVQSGCSIKWTKTVLRLCADAIPRARMRWKAGEKEKMKKKARRLSLMMMKKKKKKKNTM